jgi:hypothetical protein
MSVFGSSRSWSARAGTGGGFFTDKTCPPVEDCTVKNFLGTRRSSPEDKEGDEAGDSRGWPFAGSYEPGREKARG